MTLLFAVEDDRSVFRIGSKAHVCENESTNHLQEVFVEEKKYRQQLQRHVQSTSESLRAQSNHTSLTIVYEKRYEMYNNQLSTVYIDDI